MMLTAGRRSRSGSSSVSSPGNPVPPSLAASSPETAIEDGAPSPGTVTEAGEPITAVTAGPSVETMERELLAKYQPTTEELETLRRQRAEAVHNYLVTTGGVEAERVKVAEEGKSLKRPRVEMELE